MEFGDYVVYVDESGDHGLLDINPEYPVFVLAFCIFRIADYVDAIVPAVERLKFRYFGHDTVVFHEHEMRKARPPFGMLRNPVIRERFMNDMSALISSAPLTVVATVIRKEEYLSRGGFRGDLNPYNVALEFGLERVYMHLQSTQRGRRIHVIFESRGAKEDADLRREFGRILDRTAIDGMAETLDFVCVSKKTNSSGLQLADMVARPIGLRVIRPEQTNRAWDLIEPKVRRSPGGDIRGWGLKIYPQGSERPPSSRGPTPIEYARSTCSTT